MIKINRVRQRKIYIFLISIMAIAFIFGILYPLFISNNDKIILKDSITNYFNSINTNEFNNFSYFINSLLINIIPLLIIWIMGISIIGIPVIIFILLYKSFILGLYISSIIYSYGFKGILSALFYIFPHNIVGIVVFMLMSFYGLKMSYKLISYFFMKDNINLHNSTYKYFKILLLSIIILLFVSLYEIYINTYILRLFTKLLK